MNEFNTEETLKELLENKRISSKILEFVLTHDEIIAMFPALLTMLEEEAEIENIDYLTSLERNDAGEVIVIKELSARGLKRQYLECVLTRGIFPIDFEEERVFENSEDRKSTLIAFKNFLTPKHANYGRGIFLYGESHTGKTFIAKRLAKKIAEEGKTVGFVPINELVVKFRNDFSLKNEIIGILRRVDVLFLDDIGAETVFAWFRDETLLSVLTERIANRKPVFFTSNYSYEKLEEVEAKTSGEKFRDIDKAKKLVSKIRTLSVPVKVTKIYAG